MTGLQVKVDDSTVLFSSSGAHYPSLRMSVNELSLTGFRNYGAASIHIPQGSSVVLLGPNGAGKTNVLEAISLLTPGRGLRRAALRDIDNDAGSSVWSLSALIYGMNGEMRIGTGRDAEAPPDSAKRIIRIDGKNIKSQTELARNFAILWLTPQMDNLFIEGGTARRKFIDRLVFTFDEEHASRINAYEAAMRERNRLLATPRPDGLWLTALEQKMAEQGVAIAAARQQAVEGISLAMHNSAHHFPKADISMIGDIEEILARESALVAEESFRILLDRNRSTDAQAGRTLHGIHRSHVHVVHQEKSVPAERCSTGEQKALLVSIVLAQASACAGWHRRIPVLLLDEVSSHLDLHRRNGLYQALETIGAQCFLTGTDPGIFDGFPALSYMVQGGKITSL